MKFADIKGLGREELLVKMKDLSDEHFRLKFQHGIRPLENTARLRLLRRDIARIRTLLAVSES